MNSFRFDLDKAVAAWRHSLLHNRAFTADDLDELEQHVRDQVAALVAKGWTAQAAFRRAMREMGDYDTAETEYRKVYWKKIKRRHQLKNEISWRLSMFKNYLKIMARGLRRHPGYAFINIGGLAMGMACGLLIFLYVNDELNFDRFHQHADRIYRVVETRQALDQEERHVAFTAGPVAPTLESQVPGVASTIRFISATGTGRRAVTRGDTRFYVGDHLFVESNFFEVFGFKMRRGNPATALAEPQSVVLTERAAQQYFGSENPVGQTLQVEGFDDFTVTGVVENPPPNTHLDFSMLFPMAALQVFDGWRDYVSDWHSNIFITYVVLNEQASPAAVGAQMAELFRANSEADEGHTRTPYLQPLTAIHFGSADIEAELNAHEGARIYLYIFSTIALFILLIACINYMNLATARSMRRAREVGLRKVVGAHRKQLVGQFLGESVLVTLLGLVLALGLVVLLLPGFNTLAGKDLHLTQLGDGGILPVLVGMVVAVGVVAGSYPALYLSRFRPAHVLKGDVATGRSATNLRHGLVVVQFALSIVLIVATVVVYDQLDYTRSKGLGFNRDQLVVVDINSGNVRRNFQTIKEEFARIPSVQQVSVSSRVPGEWKNIPEVAVVPEDRPATDIRAAYFFGIDEDFLDTYKMTLLNGRSFSADRGTDSTSVLLNETAARALGAEAGTTLRFPEVGEEGFEARVIGIVEDFNFQSLHEPIAPVVLGFRNNPVQSIDYFTLRTRGNDPAATLAQLRAVGTRFDPDHPFEYNYLNDRLNDFYDDDRRLGRIFGLAALLAVVVACLGLFGLAAFTAEQRTKEIGIRKVLGASIPGLIVLMSKQFLKLVGLAFLAAVPMAYFLMRRWLDDFAYRIEISGWIFLIAGLAALGVALLTVSYQAIKAALADPVKSLRYE